MATPSAVARRSLRKANAPVPKSNGKPPDANEGQALDVRELLRTLQAVRDGDFSVRMPTDMTGLAGKVADTFNQIVLSNQQMASELERAGQTVGKEGKTRHRLSVNRRGGSWDAMESCVNTLIDDLLW